MGCVECGVMLFYRAKAEDRLSTSVFDTSVKEQEKKEKKKEEIEEIEEIE